MRTNAGSWQITFENIGHIKAKSGKLKLRLNWKILTSVLSLLLCTRSQVHAAQKGRLMTPSTFTALSGDMHVQIQLSNNDDDDEEDDVKNVNLEESKKTDGLTNSSQNLYVDNFIKSTLVISKFDVAEVLDFKQNKKKNLTSNTFQNFTNRDELFKRFKQKQILQNIEIFPDPRNNIITQVSIPCHIFTSGGVYEMQVITNLLTTTTTSTAVRSKEKSESDKEHSTTPSVTTTITTTTLIPAVDERLHQILDVRWPNALLRVKPEKLQTYPELPVEVRLQYPEVNCDHAWSNDSLAEFWLELIYCGKDSTCGRLTSLQQNISKVNVLYAEQIRGFPKLKVVQLKCELFGLAGTYVVQLRPMSSTSSSLSSSSSLQTVRRFIKVDWSNKFVFNVYARSIFPCDPHVGIGVLYEYPECILEQGDRVRLYAKLRADVASLKPPTSLHYIAEQRVVKNQYSQYFNCDLFNEKYVEYCFVYVSQAISGAVADVRMDCVPTLPVSDADTGGWGPWSEWTPCSSNCFGGTRNRYRFCDSPAPRYGAKFCEGHSVETEKCGEPVVNTWNCIYEKSYADLDGSNGTATSRVSQEVGPGCRCGCIVHIGSSKPNRIIAGATQSCPGKSYWLIQIDGTDNLVLSLNFLRISCPSQFFKVRDGPSLSSTLLLERSAGTIANIPAIVTSTGSQLLVEFYAGDDTLRDNSSANNINRNVNLECTGGFLANVKQYVKNTTTDLLKSTGTVARNHSLSMQKTKSRLGFTVAHLSAITFAGIIILISALLGIQYMTHYRKYNIAIARRHEHGSRLHTPRDSLNSLCNPPSRALSTTTLFSDVFYLVKLRPKHQLRHTILRESVDIEHLEKETDFSESSKLQSATNVEKVSISGSSLTIQNEVVNCGGGASHSPSSADLNSANINNETDDNEMNKQGGSSKDSDMNISSGMSSFCNSPPATSECDVIFKKRNDSKFLRSRSSSISLIHGRYSPAVSVVSTASIRFTNPKDSKDKQNRRKLLDRPGSEFSLGNQDDLELDYYDYNVVNAGAAPGSYLGMDPAQLIWIPPFDNLFPDDDNGYRDDDDKTPEPAPESEKVMNSRKEKDDISKCADFPHSKIQLPAYSLNDDNLPTAKRTRLHLSRKKRYQLQQQQQQSKSTISLMLDKEMEILPLNDLHKLKAKSVRNIEIHSVKRPLFVSDELPVPYEEKETAVIKSPSDLQSFLALDDIKFADESECDFDDVRLNRGHSSQAIDSNM